MSEDRRKKEEGTERKGGKEGGRERDKDKEREEVERSREAEVETERKRRTSLGWG